MLKRGEFPTELINNPGNVVNITREANQALANYYSSIPASGFTQSRTVRDWLQSQSFEDQFEFGQDVLQMVLRGQSLP